MFRLWISKVKKTLLIHLQKIKKHARIYTRTHCLADKIKEQELSAEGKIHYDYVTTRDMSLPTSKALHPPTTDDEEGQYESVIDDPLPPTVQEDYTKVDLSRLQPQSIYEDRVQPQSIYEDMVQSQPTYDNMVPPE